LFTTGRYLAATTHCWAAAIRCCYRNKPEDRITVSYGDVLALIG